MQRFLLLLTLAISGVDPIAASAEQPAAVCRDCAAMSRQLQRLQDAYQAAEARLENAKQRQVRYQVLRDRDLADLNHAMQVRPQTDATSRAIARLQRYLESNARDLERVGAEITALESRIRDLAQQIAALASELGQCNRNCKDAPPGTPIQPPSIVDEPVPAAKCPKCRPHVDAITAMQQRRRVLAAEIAALETEQDRFDAAMRQLQADLKALEAKGQPMTGLLIDGMSPGQFFERELEQGLSRTMEIRKREQEWREIDEKIREEIEKLNACNASCKSPTETGGWFSKPSTYYAFGGAVAGGLLIAGGGDSPTSTPAAPPVASPAPVTSSGPQPAPPPVEPAPQSTIAGVADCTRCAVMDDSGRHDLAINLCPQLTGGFDIAVASITIRHAAPFVDLVGAQYDPASGVFRGTTRGTVAGFPNVGITADGTANATTGEIRFLYTMGTGGELPGGRSITYSITLQKRR